MNIEIEIKNTGIFVLATVSIDGAKMLTLPFTSIEDAEKWAESCKPDIERLAKDCDCPKCREAETAKYEPEIKPEEPKPAWTPEVGMLIQSEQYGVWEITGIIDGGVELVSIPYGNKGFLPKVYLSPIAELEGLEDGESVYAISRSGDVDEYQTCGYYDKTFWVESYDVKFPVNEDGVPVFFGNGKQMFWRTRDRAERFGK
jgi:hypothetical protein